MKRIGILTLTLVLLFSLPAACSAPQQGEEGSATPPSSATERPTPSPAAGTLTPTPTTETVTPTPSPTGTPVPATRIFFRAALEQLLEVEIAPDGSSLAYDQSFGDLSENRFAIWDVDGDGEKELVFSFTTAPEAGKSEVIYCYDSQEERFSVELSEYPDLTYFSNGMILAKWSHNQGLAGEALWPYTLYTYDAARDGYQVLASVDAWDRTQSETGADGQPFPQEADPEGTGVVYFITQQDGTRTVGRQAYLAWYEQALEGAAPVELPYQNLTRQALDALS